MAAASVEGEAATGVDSEVDVEGIAGRNVAGAEHSAENKLGIGMKAGLADEVPLDAERRDAQTVDNLGLGEDDGGSQSRVYSRVPRFQPEPSGSVRTRP